MEYVKVMSTTSLPFEKDIVIGKMIREDVVCFICKTETPGKMYAILIRKKDSFGNIELGVPYEFTMVDSDNYYIWSDEENYETSDDIVFVYSPKILDSDSTQVDRALLLKYKDDKITDSVTVNFNRKDGLNLNLMWMMKNNPEGVTSSGNSGDGDIPGMGGKPEPVYGKKGGLKGVRLPNGKFQRIDTPYDPKSR